LLIGFSSSDGYDVGDQGGGEAMMNPRVRRIALYAPIVLVLLAALAFQAAALYYRYMDLPQPLPPNVGNRPIAVSMLPPKAAGAMIRFGVVGDSRGAGVFEMLMDDLKREHPDFIVLPGDMSYSASENSHMLFQVEMESEVRPTCPVFYIPGNHDVGPNYPLPLWESQYGPSQFFFKYGGNLFIFAYIVTEGENADQEQKGFDFLASTLAEQAPGPGGFSSSTTCRRRVWGSSPTWACRTGRRCSAFCGSIMSITS
jgi:hypothetical protein